MKDRATKDKAHRTLSERPEAKKYVRTDLAAECYPPAAAEASISDRPSRDEDGLKCDFYEKNGVKITHLTVSNASGAEKIGKPIGEYVTIDVGRIWLFGKKEREIREEILADQLRKLLGKYTEKDKRREGEKFTEKCVLVTGLGNRAITADALGPFSADRITATKHIKTADAALFEKLGACEVAAISPGVVGQTGIETLSLIKNAVSATDPSFVIVIDALAARSTDRIGTTVQICDSGISPGSGIGNFRRAINRESLGVPVIAIGVPTVVDSATLVLDALDHSGITEIPPSLEKTLENGRSFFVSLKESDEAITALSDLISAAIGNVFGTRFD